MNHPFDLDPAELEAMDFDFKETPSDALIDPIGSGIILTSLAVGGEGGGIQCISAPCPGSEGGGGFPFPRPRVFDPPASTDAIGEEGGGWTQAWFEGGGGPIYW